MPFHVSELTTNPDISQNGINILTVKDTPNHYFLMTEALMTEAPHLITQNIVKKIYPIHPKGYF